VYFPIRRSLPARPEADSIFWTVPRCVVASLGLAAEDGIRAGSFTLIHRNWMQVGKRKIVCYCVFERGLMEVRESNPVI